MRKAIVILFSFMMVQVGLVGCASFGQSLKSFLGGGDSTKKVKKTRKKVGKVVKNRKYQRTDHQSLQEKSKLGAGSGSLWIERGQGSYLFTQNTNRLIGDLVNVEIEGQAKKQIETKVNVITELLDRIKRQQEERRLAAIKRNQAPGEKAEKKPAPAAAATKPAKTDTKVDIKIVPSQITEILKDGSYMVEGDQPFMIGKREYKLVVKGIVRQEDFDDQGISAETLLDPKFDIVTNRKKR